MHLLSWVLASALVVTSVSAAFIQVNYFSDGGCSDYLTDVFPYTDFSCYNYGYDGMNSAGVAESTFPNGEVVCTYYVFYDCQGAQDTQVGTSNNCASNYGHGFLSMKCGIEHGLDK